MKLYFITNEIMDELKVTEQLIVMMNEDYQKIKDPCTSASSETKDLSYACCNHEGKGVKIPSLRK